jgi:hypothetical protein
MNLEAVPHPGSKKYFNLCNSRSEVFGTKTSITKNMDIESVIGQ